MVVTYFRFVQSYPGKAVLSEIFLGLCRLPINYFANLADKTSCSLTRLSYKRTTIDQNVPRMDFAIKLI